MFNKKLAAGLALALGSAFVAPCMGATPMNIHAGALGRVAPTALAARLGLGADASFVSGRPLRTAQGTVKSRERQTWHGVPVYGRSVVVERNAHGTVLSVAGSAERDVGAQLASAQPRLTARAAEAALRRHMGDAALPVRNLASKLFVYPQAGAGTRLAWRVSYVLDDAGRPSRPTAIVDADTGAILRQWDGLTTGRRPPASNTPTAVTATGPGGNELTGIYVYDNSGPGRERLDAVRMGSVCYLQGANVATYNLGGGQRVAQWSFGCPGSNPALWLSQGDAINGAYSPINDAHHFGGVVHDMYSSWFGEPPLMNDDGSAMLLSMWVHYGTNYENAFWDGSEMVFGDGDQYFFPFVVLDVTGHEISHGFTEQHSGLEYTGQSGGMNEAFSDMAGEAVKYFDRGSNDFQVGADMVKPATVPLLGMASMRDMCTPSNDGASIDSARDFRADMDVHYSSGVYNRAFCVLARTTGWDTRMAFEVFHDANALYWGPQETFDSGSCGVEQAALDRGYAEADVAAAFDAVDVTCDSAAR